MSAEGMQRAEFFVSESEATQEGLIVRGVCNRGTIALGDTFDEVERDSAPGVREPVHLRVAAITAYRRPIDQAPEGMTAELRCLGAVPRALHENDMLIAASPRRQP